MHGLGFNRFAAKYLSRVKVDAGGVLPQVSTPWYINKFAADYYGLSMGTSRTPGQVWPIIGGNAAAHVVDLFGKYDLTPFGTITHDANGMISDGSTGGCYTTAPSPKNIFPDISRWTFGFYSRTELASDTYGEMGGHNGVGKMWINPRTAAGNIRHYLGNSTERLVACPSSKGLFLGVRYVTTGGNGASTYRNGVVLSGYSDAPSGIPNPFAILHSSYALWSKRQQSFVFCMPSNIGDPVTHYNLIQALQTHCGRAV